MRLDRSTLADLVVTPGDVARLEGRSTVHTIGSAASTLAKSDLREQAASALEASREELAAAQSRLFVNGTRAVLVVLQAMDAAGKDGTIKHVMSGVNPQGCEVRSFRRPSEEELAHDYLWRASRALPRRGHIGIFNRSYYEEMLVVRVHPELLAAEHLPAEAPSGGALWRQRFDDVNAFERHLTHSGTTIVKLFLHVSKDEQRKRLLARLDDPAKQWKFDPADLEERERWDDYAHAYEELLTATSTPWAPWYVVPADRKPLARALVSAVLVHAIEELDLPVPTPTRAQRRAMELARTRLLAE